MGLPFYESSSGKRGQRNGLASRTFRTSRGRLRGKAQKMPQIAKELLLLTRESTRIVTSRRISMGRMTSHIWWKIIQMFWNHQPVMVLGIQWIRIQMPPNSPEAGSWSCAFCKLLIRDVTVLTLTAPLKQRTPIKIQSFKPPLFSQDFTPSFGLAIFAWPTQLLQDFSQPLSAS